MRHVGVMAAWKLYTQSQEHMKPAEGGQKGCLTTKDYSAPLTCTCIYRYNQTSMAFLTLFCTYLHPIVKSPTPALCCRNT